MKLESQVDEHGVEDNLEAEWNEQARYINQLLIEAFDVQAEMFEDLDADGNGKIYLEELKVYMGDMAEAFLSVADVNEDGELTRDEFFNWGKHHHRAFRQTR